jgi:hypothetical protein
MLKADVTKWSKVIKDAGIKGGWLVAGAQRRRTLDAGRVPSKVTR